MLSGTGAGAAKLKEMESITLRAMRVRLKAIILCKGKNDLVIVGATVYLYV